MLLWVGGSHLRRLSDRACNYAAAAAQSNLQQKPWIWTFYSQHFTSNTPSSFRVKLSVVFNLRLTEETEAASLHTGIWSEAESNSLIRTYPAECQCWLTAQSRASIQEDVPSECLNKYRRSLHHFLLKHEKSQIHQNYILIHILPDRSTSCFLWSSEPKGGK